MPPNGRSRTYGHSRDVADSWLPRSAFQDGSLTLPARIQRSSFDEDDIAFLKALIPHLQRALRVHRHLAESDLRQRELAEAFGSTLWRLIERLGRVTNLFIFIGVRVPPCSGMRCTRSRWKINSGIFPPFKWCSPISWHAMPGVTGEVFLAEWFSVSSVQIIELASLPAQRSDGRLTTIVSWKRLTVGTPRRTGSGSRYPVVLQQRQ